MVSISRSGYLYLGLTLACFFAIVGIFIVDGYLGLYDTLYITYQEYEQQIEFERQQYNYGILGREGAYFGGEIVAGASALYRYRIDNRTFFPCEGQLTVSLWKGGHKLADLVEREIKLAAFGSTVVEWTVSPDKVAGVDSAVEEYTNYTVKIGFAGKERRVVFGYRTRGVVEPRPVPGM